MKTPLVFLFFSMSLSTALANSDSTFMELSFGSSQMFISTTVHQELLNEEKVVLPTSSALFLGEWLAAERWSLMGAYNLPLVSQRFLVNNMLVEENANPTLLLGPRYSPMRFWIKNKIRLEPQLGVLLCAVLADDLHWTGSTAGRFHLATRDGFTMYAGGVYTLGIQGWTLFYGAGHRF